MGFNSFSRSVKLDNIKTYNSVNTTNNSFKKNFYSDIEEIDYSNYEDIDYNSINLEEGIKTTKNEKEWYEEILATGCVVTTTIISGALKIGEYADDGLLWLKGMSVSVIARLFGQEELAEKIEEWTMNQIARDKVGTINKALYEGTEIGKSINEASAMKYDSELAKGIQNVTTEAVIIVGATAATIATGGAAAPLFTVGFAVGAGQSAENKFQDTENRDFWKDSVEIGIDGTIKGLSTVAYGKAGATAVNGVKTISNLGLTGTKELVKNGVKEISKEGIKETIKNNRKTILKSTAINTLKDKDTWMETGAVLLDDVKTGVQTGEWDVAAMLADTALIYGENYIGNLGGELAGSVFQNSKKINDVKDVNSVNKLEASITDRIMNKFYLNEQAKMSNNQAFEIYEKSINDAIKEARRTGNEDIENMLDKLYLLKKQRPNFVINFDPNNGAFSDAYGTGSISLGSDVILGNRKGVVYHELGHTLHGIVNNSKVPNNYMNVKDSIYKHMSRNTDYVASCMDYFQNSQNLAYAEATKNFDEQLSNLVVEKLNKADWNEVRNNYRMAGFSEKQIEQFTQIDFENQYYNIRNSEISRLADDMQREWGVDAASDIVGSVFNGNKRFAVIDSYGNKKYLGGDTTYSHSIDYYTKIEYTDGSMRNKTLAETNEASFHEQIANYVQLKLSANASTIDMLHNLLGDEWYQMMEGQFNNITNYFK